MRLPVGDATTSSPAIRQAAAILRGGGVVAFPTDTLYGLAADPFSPAAVRRVFEAKGRQTDRALPLVGADEAQVAAELGALSDLARKLAARFWPGPLTLIVPAPARLASEVTGGTGRVGVRVPAHSVARALCAVFGGLLTATSANVSGAPATADPEEVARTLSARIDALLDGGPAPGGVPSTVVDVTGEPTLVRAGAVSWESIQQCLR
jgi:L-threonylcarbamoyladenylate synthase